MQYTRHILCSGDLLPDDTLPSDELDDLFSQLEQLKPPPSFIARMLSSIPPLSRPAQRLYWAELDHLVVRREDDPPC
jgi:hypothetical protein